MENLLNMLGTKIKIYMNH